MKSHEQKNKVQELEIFLNELRDYYRCRDAMKTRKLTSDQLEYVGNLRRTLVKKAGKYRKLIYEITEIDKLPIVVGHKEYLTDIWNVGLLVNPVIRTPTALNHCIDAVGQAIGKLEDDTEMGIRDKETGYLITLPSKIIAEPAKAFIAHGGKSEARDKLYRFLTALGATPLIIEEEPKEGRSVNEQVEYYSEQADCAIILGTADDKELKDGKLYPKRNVYIEIGRFQEKFSNKIIYLLEEGASFPSDISEKLYTRFTQESMDEAFITIARELAKFGILKAVKP